MVIPGRGGAAATVAFLSDEPGSPVELFDDRGNAIGELAGRPAELASTCETNPDDNSGCLLTSMRAVSVGGEVLFWAQRRRLGVRPGNADVAIVASSTGGNPAGTGPKSSRQATCCSPGEPTETASSTARLRRDDLGDDVAAADRVAGSDL